jgi:hypothetical protein
MKLLALIVRISGLFPFFFRIGKSQSLVLIAGFRKIIVMKILAYLVLLNFLCMYLDVDNIGMRLQYLTEIENLKLGKT